MCIGLYMYTVMTEHIVDVRKGQHSDGFDRYPYEEMKDQSLSILFEGEKQSKLTGIIIILDSKYYSISYDLYAIFMKSTNL